MTVASSVHDKALYFALCVHVSGWCYLQRRDRALRAKGLLYVGSGVSGGEDGARYGPSLMPGGSSEAW